MSSLGATIPALPVVDVGEAVHFYRDRLGFGGEAVAEGFAIVARDAAVIHLWAASDESWRDGIDAARPICSGAESFLAGTASCRIEVDGVDELFAEYRQRDVLHSVSTEISQTPWGTREFSVLDLHGNLLTFFERSEP
jgi:catechol 2,3-dioxygenase-like lactoylglutathione lyase family enzyme